MDRLSPTDRSRLMGKVRGKDTTPEIKTRKVAHAFGYRFRLHRRDLPGSPDLVFPARQKVIFVHGCFWHRHPGCRKASTPTTRRTFWQEKFDRNVERDVRKEIQLIAAGWDVLVIWECETRDVERLTKTLQEFLGAPGTSTKP
ncbi:very short patch repair endonuclease [Methylobacterium sp. J-030]|uniref:very short patch repair endonuclease n=1 Tax=Methylobacterium sp. J-030 TaxID=2836627 RepID=UPI001FB8D520|nr:very short patch repair endonuclease [Methylobacterium sp. J-030]MCJ2068896.1 very short patch repair endonuclease [Methylobacterium sp. J-030]